MAILLNMDKQDRAFTIASDMVKLLITLSTGVITFTVTFCKTFLGSISGVHSIGWLLASWIILVLVTIYDRTLINMKHRLINKLSGVCYYNKFLF